LYNIPDAIYFKDRESRFVRVSRALMRHFKVSGPEQLLGKTDFDFFTEEHARPAFEDEQRIIQTGEPIIGKLEKETHPDGRITWCLTTKMPWRDKQGKIIGTFGISRDITELKRVQDQLAYERELLKVLLDNVPDSIYFKDLNSRFVLVSRSKLLKALEHSPKLKERLAQAGVDLENGLPDRNVLIGLSDFDCLSEEDARATFEDEQQIIRTGQPIIGKIEKQTRKDGTVYWVLTTKMPWRDKDGNIIGTFGISRDITALKEAQAEVERTHRRLVDMSRMAGMAAVASEVLHNVGNVLTSVNTSCSIAIEYLQQCDLSKLAKVSELLKENKGRLDEFLTNDPKGRFIPDYLGAVAQTFTETRNATIGELTRLRGYIDHIKQIVAMQQSYAKVAGLEEQIEVAQLVEDALRINEAALDRHNVTVRREIEPVPSILVDKHKVLQILVNLIRNAKYALSDSGRPDRILTLRVCRNGEDKVKIQVIDNGIGIPPENLTRIFSHGFTTRGDGHGFGLHSGALLAKELGGELSAYSEGVGKGATFTLVLPLKPPQRK
ncbi:MAG: PAS domain-containing protein, partial [Verrucomicrobiae bacterium]|nr:PAS domain-containing protein [Verrucomicrobiae bacterium]